MRIWGTWRHVLSRDGSVLYDGDWVLVLEHARPAFSACPSRPLGLWKVDYFHGWGDDGVKAQMAWDEACIQSSDMVGLRGRAAEAVVHVQRRFRQRRARLARFRLEDGTRSSEMYLLCLPRCCLSSLRYLLSAML